MLELSSLVACRSESCARIDFISAISMASPLVGFRLKPCFSRENLSPCLRGCRFLELSGGEVFAVTLNNFHRFEVVHPLLVPSRTVKRYVLQAKAGEDERDRNSDCGDNHRRGPFVRGVLTLIHVDLARLKLQPVLGAEVSSLLVKHLPELSFDLFDRRLPPEFFLEHGGDQEFFGCSVH